MVSLTRFELCDGLLIANIPYDDAGEITYLLDREPDWAYIQSLLDFDAPNPDPDPRPPELFIYLTGSALQAYEMSDDPLYAQSRVLSITDGSGSRVPEFEYSGIGGFSNYALTEVKLSFTYSPPAYTVTVEPWDEMEAYTVKSSQLVEDVLPLWPLSLIHI